MLWPWSLEEEEGKFCGWRSGHKERRKRKKVLGVRVNSDEGIFGFSKAIVGNNSVGHVIHFSVNSNGNLDKGGNERAIESNWEINYSNQKFREDIEK